ncbi:MAG: hypothetical protein C3F15_09335 [Holophagae bacterium]|nr:MAG: hypothetical protein C3F15_09335 [Holophagae bacterium]
MTKDTGRSTAGAEAPRAMTSPLLLLAAWLVPGLGHWILGKRRRALVFFAVVVCAFLTGVLVDGELGTPRPGEPFSWLATLACLGNGLLYLARLVWINGVSGALGGLPFGLDGGGDPIAVGFTYGNTFLYTGGLMNLLLMLDVSDIARGEKD